MNGIDFRYIKGPKNSKQANFEELCTQLIMRHFKNVKPVEGSGGDEGIDIYRGDSFLTFRHIFQCKYFIDPLNQSHKRQITESLERVKDREGLNCWTLCLPRNLNPTE
jgi:hypothetical protein